MDKKTYKLITTIWTFLKSRINDMENNNTDEWWESERKELDQIMAMGDNEPEYFRQFVEAICIAADLLLFNMHFERKENK